MTNGRKEEVQKIELNDDAIVLVIVRDEQVMHHSGNLLLSHAEFVKGQRAHSKDGAWVGTVHKVDGAVMAFSSKTFYGVEMPAPQWVSDVARASFA